MKGGDDRVFFEPTFGTWAATSAAATSTTSAAAIVSEEIFD